jgi:hypothetical protein
MSIRTDVTNARQEVAPPSLKPSTAERRTGRASLTSVPNKSKIAKSVGDALSIAQMSQSLIQRALSISSRLNSIAQDAISTGKINVQEINETLSDIKNTLGGYEETMANPVQALALPDIAGEIQTVKDIAAELKKGAIVNTERMDSLNKSLNEKFMAFRTIEERFAGMMDQSATGYPAGIVNSRELISSIKTEMEKNPAHAIAVQGNIQRLAAGKLFA